MSDTAPNITTTDASNMDPAAVAAELETLYASNMERQERLRTMWNVILPGLDIMYVKTALDFLVGSYELPKVRLMHQRVIAEMLDQAETPEAEADFARQNAELVSQMEAQQQPRQLLDHLGRGGRRR
jgi:hypothetical protein